jgi:hypothetical protein
MRQRLQHEQDVRVVLGVIDIPDDLEDMTIGLFNKGPFLAAEIRMFLDVPRIDMEKWKIERDSAKASIYYASIMDWIIVAFIVGIIGFFSGLLWLIIKGLIVFVAVLFVCARAALGLIGWVFAKIFQRV